ncbi:hypothetical protein CB0940_04603 [Cercospora beticola]|uniref:Dystroglycan-type cadherin-like domain-containing protein n=1 Tax=Cercospora beticola TaxID=122368 RepID=A0A2G5HMF4_CERBT|nr:hypothetical protein CB0940_04603 [Cercospora beticola]PIA93729.1 hypothetical protein CB0940_04603 [Cercospora beticola]WPB01856.1 hypothetical protein RHO25_006488 [Cercospora beticola]
MARLVARTLAGVSCTLCALFTTAAAVPNAAFPFNSQVPTVARVGQQYSFQISDSTFEPESSTYVYSISQQPAWLTIDSATRTLQGTPGTSDAGPETFVLTAADGSGAAQMSCTLVVSADPAPRLVGDISEQLSETANLSSSMPPVVTLLPSTPFKFDFEQESFIDIVQRQLYYYATLADHTPLPSWLKFDAEKLTFSGNAPDLSAFPQSWVINLIASDVPGFSGSTASFTIAVGTQQLVFVPEEQELNITAGKDVNITTLQSELFRNNVNLSPRSLRSAIADTPSWLAFDSSTLAITGEAPEDFETGNITVTVTDELGNTAMAVINLIAGKSSFFNGQIGTLLAQAGKRFSYHLDDSLFNEQDLDISVELPTAATWLRFDDENRELTGMVPSSAQAATLRATITARSGANDEGQSQVFTIDVEAATRSSTTSAVISPTNTHHATPAAAAVDQEKPPTLTSGGIAAIVLGSIVGASLLLLLLLWCCRRKRRQDSYVQNSPRSKTISKPLAPPQGEDIVPATMTDLDLEKASELARVDSHAPVPPPKSVEPPPQIHIHGIPETRSSYFKRFSRVSHASSLGDGEDAIRRDENIPEWGANSTALHMPHDSFSVPTEMARRSTHLSDTSPSKRAQIMHKVRAHRRNRSSVSFKRLSLGLGITGAGAAAGAGAGVARHSSRNGRLRHRKARSSLGVLTPTREASSAGSFRTIRTSILSATPSDFPEPGPSRQSYSASAPVLSNNGASVELDPKRKSIRMVAPSNSIHASERERPLVDKRTSFLAKRRGSGHMQSILFSRGTRSASTSLRRNDSQSVEASVAGSVRRANRGTSGLGSRSALPSQNTLTKYSESSSIEPRGHLDSPHRDSRRFSQRLKNVFVPGFPRAITQSTLGNDEDGVHPVSGRQTPAERKSYAELEDEQWIAELTKPRHERDWVRPGESSPLTAPAPPPSLAATAQNSRAGTPSATSGASPSRSERWREAQQKSARERSASPLSQSHDLNSSPSVIRKHRQPDSGKKNRMSAPMSLVSADSMHKGRPRISYLDNTSNMPTGSTHEHDFATMAGSERDDANWVTDVESSLSSSEDEIRGTGLVIPPLGGSARKDGTGRSDWTGTAFI